MHAHMHMLAGKAEAHTAWGSLLGMELPSINQLVRAGRSQNLGISHPDLEAGKHTFEFPLKRAWEWHVKSVVYWHVSFCHCGLKSKINLWLQTQGLKLVVKGERHDLQQAEGLGMCHCSTCHVLSFASLCPLLFSPWLVVGLLTPV